MDSPSGPQSILATCHIVYIPSVVYPLAYMPTAIYPLIYIPTILHPSIYHTIYIHIPHSTT